MSAPRKLFISYVVDVGTSHGHYFYECTEDVVVEALGHPNIEDVFDLIRLITRANGLSDSITPLYWVWY